MEFAAYEALVRSVHTADAEVHPWKQGVDFAAHRVESASLPAAVLRVPLEEHIDDAFNDGDFGDLIEKECAAYELLRAGGVPVPIIHARDTTRSEVPFSWMLMELVDCEEEVVVDDSLSRQLGSITNTIHSIALSEPLGRPIGPWPDFVDERIGARLDSLRSLTTLPSADSVGSFIRSAVVTTATDDRLLHLDLRATNMCVRNGKIVALIDLSNCLSGDPWFELGRMHAYGLFDEPFRIGYGLSEDELDAHRELLDVYALDTWALLAMLAAEHLADEALLDRSVNAICSTLKDL